MSVHSCPLCGNSMVPINNISKCAGCSLFYYGQKDRGMDRGYTKEIENYTVEWYDIITNECYIIVEQDNSRVSYVVPQYLPYDVDLNTIKMYITFE